MIKFLSTLISLLFVLSGCKKEDNNDPDGELFFTVCPVDTAYISEASPLGNVNPPGHTFPSNHIGFYIRGGDFIPVYAMAGGTITSLYYNEWSDDYRIEISYSESVMYYLDHICNITSLVREGAALLPGDLLGYAETGQGAFDIGVVNYSADNIFIVPERYHEFYLYYDDPYEYFTDSIREILELKNPRIGEPKGGKVDYDTDGTLAGNWFLEGTPLTWEASSYIYGANQLAFVYDMYNASTLMIACGGTLEAAPFAYRVVGNSPDPVDVTISSGIIIYELEAFFFDCTLLVQLIENRKLKAEVFRDEKPEDIPGFTAQAKIYVR